MTSPSQPPETSIVNAVGLLARQCTPSICPLRAPTNGLAKCLSSLTAFSARTYSRPFWNGCSSGCWLRFTLVSSWLEPFMKSRRSRLIALIFIAVGRVPSQPARGAWTG